MARFSLAIHEFLGIRQGTPRPSLGVTQLEEIGCASKPNLTSATAQGKSFIVGIGSGPMSFTLKQSAIRRRGGGRQRHPGEPWDYHSLRSRLPLPSWRAASASTFSSAIMPRGAHPPAHADRCQKPSPTPRNGRARPGAGSGRRASCRLLRHPSPMIIRGLWRRRLSGDLGHLHETHVQGPVRWPGGQVSARPHLRPQSRGRPEFDELTEVPAGWCSPRPTAGEKSGNLAEGN